MSLLYKKDWEIAKNNYKLWWEHEYFGRSAIAVTAPKENMKKESPPPIPEKNEDKFLDFNFLALNNDYIMRNTFYGGEAFPLWENGLTGGDNHALFLGASVMKHTEDATWISPLIENGKLTDYDYKKFVINKNNIWWKYRKEVRELAVRESKGKSIPSNIGFGASGDTLAMLRTSEKLLFDLVDCPDYVCEFDKYLMEQWIYIFQESYNITSEGAQAILRESVKVLT